MMMRIFICLWQNEQQETAMKALEHLCENSKDEAQVVTALRSVKTKLKFEYQYKTLILFILKFTFDTRNTDSWISATNVLIIIRYIYF